GAGMVMGEKIPGIALFAVIVADRAPLPLGEVRPPLLPGHALVTHTTQPSSFYDLTRGNRGILLNLRLHGSCLRVHGFHIFSSTRRLVIGRRTELRNSNW